MDNGTLDQVVRALLLQPYNEKLHPVACFGKNYCTAVKNYPVLKKELLIIFRACQKWRYYLDRHPTTV